MSAWDLYDRLIAGIPQGIAVRDACLGTNWSYVDAECGMGLAHTIRSGAQTKGGRELRGAELRDVALLAKSWCFEEATLGVAALNAWYSRDEMIAPLRPTEEIIEYGPNGEKIRRNDAFELARPAIEACGEKRGVKARVVVVGHFPHVAAISQYADLTVLERNCQSPIDTPDPACEYVIPGADFVFITGTTLTNKTAPRLIELAHDAYLAMVGPSVVLAPVLFDFGVDSLGGSVVRDPEHVASMCKIGYVGSPFGKAIAKVSIDAAV